MSKSKYYVFTINNPSIEEEEILSNLSEDASYLCVGFETGEGGTPHFQGYIEFKNRKTLAQVKRVPGFSRAHLERRKGTSQEASAYCKKDGNFKEFGILSVSKQGKRSDLDKVVESIKEGASVKDLWETHTGAMIKYERGIKAARSALKPVVDHEGFPLETFEFHPLVFPENKTIIIKGKSGCRKTSYVISRFPRILLVSHLDQLMTYDPEKHQGILFDDVSISHLHREAQIHLVDQDFERHIHVRYTTAVIPRRTLKIFTCNDESWPIVKWLDPAIHRRMHLINV